jgi:PilZ domain-containing protein
MSTAELKSKLKQLRDRLAAEAPRARARSSAPAELVERLEATLQLVNGIYLAATAPSAGAIQELSEDAIAEGHLVLHDWERWLEREKEPKPTVRMRPVRLSELPDRRAHERYEAGVSVRIVRHGVREQAGSVSIESAAVDRPARNVSTGGIFVAVPKDDLPQVGVGAIVHISVNVESESFAARAAVTRRETDGLALRWIQDSPQAQRYIESVLDAVRRVRARGRDASPSDNR